MTRSLSLILVLTLMSGCAVTQPSVEEEEGSGPGETDYSFAMLYHLQEISYLQSPESEREKPVETRATARYLRQLVWEFNEQSSNMCAKGLYPELSCLPALDPPWLTEAQDKSPTKKELERRADYVNELVQKLWHGVCEDFKKSHPDPDDYMGYCSIE